MSQKSSDPVLPPRPTGPDGLLARKDFTPERIAYFSQMAERFGENKFLTEEERETSRQTILADHIPGSELWVFGYGSLMWRPGFAFEEQAPARLMGAHRALCVYSVVHRGTHAEPGLVLGLDKGGACRGVAFRVVQGAEEETLACLRARLGYQSQVGSPRSA